MGLFRYIVQGFGWRVGGEIAKEAIADVQKALSEEGEADEAPAPMSEREAKRQARAAERAAKKRAAEEQKAARRREREIDDELRELKKRVGRS